MNRDFQLEDPKELTHLTFRTITYPLPVLSGPNITFIAPDNETKKHFYYDSSLCSAAYMPFPSNFEEHFWNTHINVTRHLLKIPNAFVSHVGSFIFNNAVYHDPAQRVFNFKINDTVSMRIIRSPLLSVFHDHYEIYGHSSLDFFPHLLIVPHFLWKSVYLVHPGGSYFPWYFAYADIVGFPLTQILLAGSDDLLFTKTYYTFQELTLASILNPLIPATIQKLNELSLKYFKIDKKPFKYAIINPQPTSLRPMRNFDEVIAYTRQKYPDVKIETKVTYFNISIQAQFFSSCKLLVGVHSSLLFNMIFMQRGYVLGELAWECVTFCFSNAYFMGLSIGLKVVYLRNPGLDHVTPDFRPDPKIISKVFGTGLNYLIANKEDIENDKMVKWTGDKAIPIIT